jgi:hypothetical protein
MQWKRVKRNVLQANTQRPWELIQEITLKLVSKFGAKAEERDALNRAIPELGFIRSFDIHGKNVLLSQESYPEEPLELVFEANEEEAFILRVKGLLEEINES